MDSKCLFVISFAKTKIKFALLLFICITNPIFVLKQNFTLFASYRRLKQSDIIIESDYNSMSRTAVKMFISELKAVLQKKDKAVVMLPTGGTYLSKGGFYQILTTEYRNAIDWSRVIFFNLDEYIGVSPKDKRSYNYQLMEAVLEPLGVPLENIHLFDGSILNVKEECAKREQWIKKLGGIDITLLGIGRNGHIGFNEPGSLRNSGTRVVDLSLETKYQNMEYFKDLGGGDLLSGIDSVPDQAITVGIATILSSREIFLLASGQSKAEAVKNMLNEENPLLNPASFLIINSPGVCFIFDDDAFSLFHESQLQGGPF